VTVLQSLSSKEPFSILRAIGPEVFRDRLLSDMFAGLHRTIVELCDNIDAGLAYYGPTRFVSNDILRDHSSREAPEDRASTGGDGRES
jgi:hypothetical protein